MHSSSLLSRVSPQCVKCSMCQVPRTEGIKYPFQKCDSGKVTGTLINQQMGPVQSQGWRINKQVMLESQTREEGWLFFFFIILFPLWFLNLVVFLFSSWFSLLTAASLFTTIFRPLLASCRSVFKNSWYNLVTLLLSW